MRIYFNGESTRPADAATSLQLAGCPEWAVAAYLSTAEFAWVPDKYESGPNVGKPCLRNPVTRRTKPPQEESELPKTATKKQLGGVHHELEGMLKEMEVGDKSSTRPGNINIPQNKLDSRDALAAGQAALDWLGDNGHAELADHRRHYLNEAVKWTRGGDMPGLARHIREHIKALPVHAAIAAVDMLDVPVMNNGLNIERKVQASMARDLMKRLGIKGVSITAPSYSQGSGVDIKFPKRHDFHHVGSGHGHDYMEHIKHPGWIANREIENKLAAILVKAFALPMHQRNDQFFHEKWSFGT